MIQGRNERRDHDRRSSDQTLSWRVEVMENGIEDLKSDFAEIKGDVREISRKIDMAFADEGVIGKLNQRVGKFEIDKLSWKRVIAILSAIAAAGAAVITYFADLASRVLGK